MITNGASVLVKLNLVTKHNELLNNLMMTYDGIQWNTMEYYGILWHTMAYYVIR